MFFANTFSLQNRWSTYLHTLILQAHELYVTFSIPFDQFKDLSYKQASHIIDNFRDKGLSFPRKFRYVFITTSKMVSTGPLQPALLHCCLALFALSLCTWPSCIKPTPSLLLFRLFSMMRSLSSLRIFAHAHIVKLGFSMSASTVTYTPSWRIPLHLRCPRLQKRMGPTMTTVPSLRSPAHYFPPGKQVSSAHMHKALYSKRPLCVIRSMHQAHVSYNQSDSLWPFISYLAKQASSGQRTWRTVIIAGHLTMKS
jgi:hypothetical protein